MKQGTLATEWAWLNWRGDYDRKERRVIYPRAWTPAIDTTAPNYLRNRFKEIREEIEWADYMEKQNPRLTIDY